MVRPRESRLASKWRTTTGALSLGVVLAVPPADAQRTIRDAVAQRRGANAEELTVVRDVAYGADRKQRFDVYAPKNVRGAPVILMVHGGGWRYGDKRSRGSWRTRSRAGRATGSS